MNNFFHPCSHVAVVASSQSRDPTLIAAVDFGWYETGSCGIVLLL